MPNDTALIRCSNCGTVNRIHPGKLHESPRCGKCKAPLRIPNRPVIVTASDFDREVVKWPGLVLIEFWTPFCVHCQAMAPVLDALARERAGKLKIVKINAEREPMLARQFSIMGTPAFLLYRNGNKLGEIPGALPKAQLEKWIDSEGNYE
ncbi:MAG: thioredoxin domain-containing protein [Pseudomonadota bacterium]